MTDARAMFVGEDGAANVVWEARATEAFDPFTELCVCGHPGRQHCLDDDHCAWSHAHGERGGACLDLKCGCCTYRPRSLHPSEEYEESASVAPRRPST